MEHAKEAVSAALRAEAAAQRVTYDQIVERTHLSKSTVVRYMTGKRSVPTEDLMRIAIAIGADPMLVFADAQRRLRESMEREDES